MPKKKKPKHGGPRPGSGRPKKADGTKRVVISATVAPETRDALHAKRGGKPLGVYLDTLFKKS